MARYTPGNVPNDPAALPDFLRQEFAKMAQALETETERVTFATLYAYPSKYRDGTVFKTDGATLNPGAGAGYYGYHSGVWNKLG